jgi:hypothetical protein
MTTETAQPWPTSADLVTALKALIQQDIKDGHIRPDASDADVDGYLDVADMMFPDAPQGVPADQSDAVFKAYHARAVAIMETARAEFTAWLATLPEKAPALPFTRTTEELEEILDIAVEEQATDDFEAVADNCPLPVPDGGLYLTRYIPTDQNFILVFNNGHVEFLEQVAPQDGETFDGDLWDVTPLGWG